jgi:hypothetical protein
MPKAYLNKEEKTTVKVLSAFCGYLEGMIEQLGKSKNSKAAVKWAKTARSFTFKTLDEFMLPLDEDERRKVVELAEKMDVIIKYKHQVEQELKRIEKLDAYVHMEKEDFSNLVELALASCSVCETDGKDCRFKKLLIKYDVDPLNFTDRGCPYRIE